MTQGVSKEQFLANPRSCKIRGICLEIADNMQNILEGIGDKRQATANIEALSGQLIVLGIQKNMHIGSTRRPESDYIQPIIMAEYVAGLLLDHMGMGEYIPSLKEAAPIIKEFVEPQPGLCTIPNPGEMPQRAKHYLFSQSTVNLTYDFLDAND